jgi:hypothetical protein
VIDGVLTQRSRPSPRSLACHPHLLATRVTVRARLLLVVVAVVTAARLPTTITETAEVVVPLAAVLVVTALVVMTITVAEVPRLATMTTAEIPTHALPHPAPAALQSMTTHSPEAVLTQLTTAMVHLLQPVVMRLTPTPTAMAESPGSLENLESPESLTAAPPPPPQDASADTMQATIVDLTGDYPLLLAHLTETNLSYFRVEETITYPCTRPTSI